MLDNVFANMFNNRFPEYFMTYEFIAPMNIKKIKTF